MKKLFPSFFITFLFLSLPAFSDDFTDTLQDLAIQTACIGQYSATQAGGGWYDDPHDYYTPQRMATRFKQMSGSRTKTDTFYGVCFDYAEAAYKDIKTYQSYYNNQGMYENQYFIACVYGDSSVITLASPTNSYNATTIQNGVYVKTYGSSSYKYVKTHKTTSGNRATNHCWIWIMRDDGIWFWVDPTWTDNLGYPVYGYVSYDEEIQCRPDKNFCERFPDYLQNLPSPPSRGAKKAPSSSSNSYDYNYSYSNSYSNSNYGNHYSSETTAYFTFGYIGQIDFSDMSFAHLSNEFQDYRKCGIELALEMNASKGKFFPIFLLDFLFDHLGDYDDDSTKNYDGFLYSSEDGIERKDAVLFGLDIGYGLLSFFQPYVGGLIGIQGTETEDSWEKPRLAWKGNGGFCLAFSGFCLRFELSRSSVLGNAGTIAFGFGGGL